MNRNNFIHIVPYSLFIIPTLVFGAFDRDLTVGNRGSDVESLQNFLTQQAVYSGPITGYFGNLTKDGVKKFQEKNSITPIAGYFGPKTRGIANQLISGQSGQVNPAAPSAPLTASDLQKQIEVLTLELQKLQSAPAIIVPAPADPIPAPEPAVFSGSVKIFSIYPNVTLSTYVDVPLNEFQISDSTQKVAITKLRLVNNGTLSDVYFNEVRLVNSLNNEVLAAINSPIEKVIEFNLISDSVKKDKGLMVSGGVYAVRANLKTLSSGSERKPNIKLDILSVSDVAAVDYETLSKPAKFESIFPVEGPYITTF